jgi:hypothetical protein
VLTQRRILLLYRGVGSSFTTHVWGNNDAVVPGFDSKDFWQSPDIDVHTSFNIGLTDLEDGNQLLSITDSISGDAFPAAEAFVNIGGTKLFLAKAPAQYGPNAGPFYALLGDNKRPMAIINGQFVVTKYGKYVSQQWVGEKGGRKLTPSQAKAKTFLDRTRLSHDDE